MFYLLVMFYVRAKFQVHVKFASVCFCRRRRRVEGEEGEEKNNITKTIGVSGT